MSITAIAAKTAADTKSNKEALIKDLREMTGDVDKIQDVIEMIKNRYLNAITELAKPSQGCIHFTDCLLTDAHLEKIFLILNDPSQKHNHLSLDGGQKFSVEKLEQHIIKMLEVNPEAAYCLSLPLELSLKPSMLALWGRIRINNGARILSPNPEQFIPYIPVKLTAADAKAKFEANMATIAKGEQQYPLDFTSCELNDAQLEAIFKALHSSQAKFSGLCLAGNQKFSMEKLTTRLCTLLSHMATTNNRDLFYTLHLPYELAHNQEIRQLWDNILKTNPNPARRLSFENEQTLYGNIRIADGIAVLNRFNNITPGSNVGQGSAAAVVAFSGAAAAAASAAPVVIVTTAGGASAAAAAGTIDNRSAIKLDTNA